MQDKRIGSLFCIAYSIGGGNHEVELQVPFSHPSQSQECTLSPAGKCIEEGAIQGFGNAFWRGGP